MKHSHHYTNKHPRPSNLRWSLRLRSDRARPDRPLPPRTAKAALSVDSTDIQDAAVKWVSKKEGFPSMNAEARYFIRPDHNEDDDNAEASLTVFPLQ